MSHIHNVNLLITHLQTNAFLEITTRSGSSISRTYTTRALPSLPPWTQFTTGHIRNTVRKPLRVWFKRRHRYERWLVNSNKANQIQNQAELQKSAVLHCIHTSWKTNSRSISWRAGKRRVLRTPLVKHQARLQRRSLQPRLVNHLGRDKKKRTL